MRNTLIRIIYAVVLFFAAFILMEVFAGGNSTQTTAEMSDAVLPVVYMETGSTVFNPLHGFTGDQDPGEDRASLTPIGSDRTVQIRIDMKGGTLLSAKAEARNTGGDRLIESEDLSAEESGENGLAAEASFSNLIEADTEYLLIIILNLESTSGRTVTARYNTRICWKADDSDLEEAQSALSFVQNFHAETFDKTKQDDLLTYLEPDDSGDNGSLAKVTLYSSADQVTWADLAPEEVTGPVYSITDIQNGSIGISGTSFVTTKPDQTEDSQAESLYHVTESYELRRGTRRFYLMDYERTMEQVFDPENPQGADGNLDLGITDPSIEAVGSSDGDTVAFVQDGRLYAVQASGKLMTYLYGFGDSDSTDERDSFDHHGFRILDVLKDGSVDFIVYGYMNAGRHEGKIGVSFLHYSGSHHTLEEKAFVPYEGGWDVLKWRVGECSYYNREEGKLYLLLDDRLVEVDVDACTIRTVADDLAAKKTVLSESGQMAAWEEWDNNQATGRIVLMNLESLSEQIIPADGERRAIPLGFLGEDLIYGTANPADAVTDRLGTSLEPMDHVIIVDPGLHVLEDYHPDGYYVTGIETEDNQVTLNRVQKDESGSYITAPDDQIVSSEEEETGELTQTSNTDRYERTVQIATAADIASLRYIRPEEILYEGSRELAVRSGNEGSDVGNNDEEDGNSGSAGSRAAAGPYFAWESFGLVSVETDIREAIEEAGNYDTGVVVNDAGRYYWKGSSPDRSEIDALTVIDAGTVSQDSMAVCLEALLSFEGTSTDVAGRLQSGNTAIQILQDSLPDSDVMDLSGCTMDRVLYYVGVHIPVLALTGSGNAVLIVGYGPENVELYDPAAGSVHLAARDTAERLFEAAGNRFIAVVPAAS